MPTIYTSTEVISYSLNDQIHMNVRLDENFLDVYCFNATTGSDTTFVHFYYNTGSTAGLKPNAGKFCLWALGGSGVYDVNYLKVKSAESKYPAVLFQGDSKTADYLASKPETHFTHLIRNNYGYKVVNYGGPSDGSAEFLAASAFITNWIKPQYVVLMGVANDPRNGVAAGTTQSNISTLVSNLQGAGVTVRIVTGLYETSGNDQTGFQSWANSNYSSSMVIDILTTVLDLSDGVHESDAGNSTLATTLISSGKLPTY